MEITASLWFGLFTSQTEWHSNVAALYQKQFLHLQRSHPMNQYRLGKQGEMVKLRVEILLTTNVIQILWYTFHKTVSCLKSCAACNPSIWWYARQIQQCGVPARSIFCFLGSGTPPGHRATWNENACEHGPTPNAALRKSEILPTWMMLYIKNLNVPNKPRVTNLWTRSKSICSKYPPWFESMALAVMTAWFRLWWASWLSVPGWWNHGWRWSLAVPVFPSISTANRMPVLTWWDLVLSRFCCQTNSNLKKKGRGLRSQLKALGKGIKFLCTSSTENQGIQKIHSPSQEVEIFICWTASHGSDCHLCHHQG